jgi:hypothetical protein
MMPVPPGESHCPYGCGRDGKGRINELGYCKHLIGFTNDEQVLEPLSADVDRNGQKTGVLRVLVSKKQLVRKTDKLVNPEYQQLDKGVWHTAKKWLSARVYSNILPRPEMTEKEIAVLAALSPNLEGEPEISDEELDLLTQPEGVLFNGS